ncbi:MAG: hypothetical protein IKZ82_02930 [Clostridia bacterium]|nr:hypothetical protein [Clostridia bacterium]
MVEAEESSISTDEVEAMRTVLEVRELYADDFVVELLYDADNQQSFLLGSTSLGSAIMERSTRTVCEWSEFNTYDGCGAGKKYYGGVLQYYVKRSDSEKYINIRTGVEETAPSRALIVEDFERAIVPDPTNPGGSQQGEIYEFPDNSEYIRRYAFGLNTSQTNSCSEVALGIALNYLYRKYNFHFSLLILLRKSLLKA